MNSPPLTNKSKKKTKGEKTKAKAKAKTKDTDGLCATCNNEPDCTLKNTRGPVHQCEEFDAYQEPAGRIEHIAAPKKDNGNGKEGRKFKGLCVNCNHRETCVNAGLEGGVWHCEEYE